MYESEKRFIVVTFIKVLVLSLTLKSETMTPYCEAAIS